MRVLNQAGLDLIKSFEGLRLSPYLDQSGVATIGYGTILYPNGQSVTMQDPSITAEQASEYLLNNINQKTKLIESIVTVDVNDNEFAALTSFAYNCGVGALQGSTLLKLLNSGTDKNLVAQQFLRWDKVNGIENAGLLRRRQEEMNLFLTPIDSGSSGSSSSDTQVNLADIDN